MFLRVLYIFISSAVCLITDP